MLKSSEAELLASAKAEESREVHPKRDPNGDKPSFSNNGNYSGEPPPLHLSCRELQIGPIRICSCWERNAEQPNFISLISDHIFYYNVMKETSKKLWHGALLLWGESLGSAFHINLSLVYSRIQESQRYFKSDSHLLAKHYSVLPSSLSFYLRSVHTAAPRQSKLQPINQAVPCSSQLYMNQYSLHYSFLSNAV